MGVWGRLRRECVSSLGRGGSILVTTGHEGVQLEGSGEWGSGDRPKEEDLNGQGVGAKVCSSNQPHVTSFIEI